VQLTFVNIRIIINGASESKAHMLLSITVPYTALDLQLLSSLEQDPFFNTDSNTGAEKVAKK